MSDAEAIKELADGLDPDITFTLEACESMTVIPKMFRKMALKTMIKGAKEEGVTVIDKEFAETFKP